jgi:hypothetical protein
MDPAQRRSVREAAAEVASLAATLRPDIDRDLDPARVATVLARIRDLAAAVLADLEQPAPADAGRPPRPRSNVVGFRRATDPGHIPVAVAHVHRYGPNLVCLCGTGRRDRFAGPGPASLPDPASLDTADPTGYRHPHPRSDGHLSWCRGDHDPTRTDCPPDHGFPWGYRAVEPDPGDVTDD